MVHNFYQIGGGEHTVFKNEVELLRDNGHEVMEIALFAFYNSVVS